MIIIACTYIILFPFLQTATFTLKSVIVGAPSSTMDVQRIDRNKNQLYIPSIRLTQPILEGLSPKTVNLGVWRVPTTSTPEQESNTVLVGHRFSYKDPSVFYHFDKIEKGDNIYVSWKKKIYVYKVDTIRVVTPKVNEVEAPTKDPRLTLYTCTPLWSTSHRLVIESKLEKVL